MNSSFDGRISYTATQSNRDAILAVLGRVLPMSGLVLEVASGTGEHAAYFASQLPGILRGAGRLLAPGSPLYFYGAFRVDGRHTAPSNEAFDRGLRRHDPEWGVRDLESVAAEAAVHGLVLAETVDMPRDNLSVVFRKA